MGQLDKTDVEILQVLQKDAKVNTKELSEKLHISKTPIYERIKRLENDGYIKGYVALVDNKKVGLPLIVFCLSGSSRRRTYKALSRGDQGDR